MTKMIEREGKLFFDCGCVAWKEGKTFFTRPHDFNCKVYKTILEESNRRFNRLEFRIEK